MKIKCFSETYMLKQTYTIDPDLLDLLYITECEGAEDYNAAFVAQNGMTVFEIKRIISPSKKELLDKFCVEE